MMKQKTALVTGASSGIGKAIAEALLEENYIVYGIGRDFSGCTEQDDFHRIICDLRDTDQLMRKLQDMPADDLDLLVNNAGCAYYGMHETLKTEKIREMARVDLELPMILCQSYLRTLRKNKGMIINIASITAVSVNTHGAAYGALKAGLLSFGRSLFEENRKTGLRVTTILPDMTDTALYRNADFMPDPADGCALDPADIASAVLYALHQREGVTVPEITIRPQFRRIRKK